MNEQCVLLIWLCMPFEFSLCSHVSVLGLQVGRVSAPQSYSCFMDVPFEVHDKQ